MFSKDRFTDEQSFRGFCDKFSKVNHVALCYMYDGRIIYDYAFDEEMKARLTGGPDPRQEVLDYEPSRLSELEDIEIRYQYRGSLMQAILEIKASRGMMTWFLTGLAEGEEVQEEEKREFEEKVEFLAFLTKKFTDLRTLERIANREARETLRESLATGDRLNRLEVMNEIHRLAESDGEVDVVIGEILSCMHRLFTFSKSSLYRVDQTKGRVIPVKTWHTDGSLPESGGQEADLVKLPFHVDRTYMISHDTPLPQECRLYMEDHNAGAMMRFPVKDGKNPIFVIEIADEDRSRTWELEDIKTANEIRQILEWMISIRLSKHSITASYLSMKSILENVDCAVCVVDGITESPLFMNQKFRDSFLGGDKVQGNENLREVIELSKREDDAPIFYEKLNCWVEFSHKGMPWVDGRETFLIEAYDISDYKVQMDERASLGSTEIDIITGLYNRKRCEQDFEVLVKQCRKEKKTGALISLDVDDFKYINSKFGMQAGDGVLRDIANRMKKMHIVGGTVYRLRSDEFYILVPPENYGELGEVTAELQKVFDEPFSVGSTWIDCTVSVGVIAFPEYGASMDELEPKVELAMYEAKNRGKNCVAVFNLDMAVESHRQQDLQQQLKAAVHDGCKEFEVYYQPIMDVKKFPPVCVGAEALLRWNSQKYGQVSPTVFIPIAEQLGLISELGEFALKEACVACRYWNDFGHPEYRINVNFSVIQFMQKNIYDIVKKVLLSTRLDPGNLVMEITESMEVDSMQRMNSILQDVRSLGVRVALDDFGTGYASLSHVHDLFIDTIKVDRQFVEGILVDQYADTFVKMVTELANVIDVDVCVEGVETQMQYDLLRSMNVSCIQGFYFDTPQPRDAFENKYLIS